MRRPADRLLLLGILPALGALALATARAQDPRRPDEAARRPDEAHLRRAIDLDPAHALDELNPLVKDAPDEPTRARLRVLRALALARLGEKEDALRDLRAAIAQTEDEPLEAEAGRLVRELRGLEVRLDAPAGAVAPGAASVALVVSGRGSLAVEWTLYRAVGEKLRADVRADPARGLAAHLRRPRPATLERVDAWHQDLALTGPLERSVAIPRAREPGVYLVTATVADAPVRATLVVARHAILGRVAAKGGLAFVCERETGAPLASVELDRLGPAGLERLGATDARGLLPLDPLAAGEVLAWHEGSLARLGLGFPSSEVPAPAAAPVEIVLESPLARPGEPVRAFVLSQGTLGSVALVLEDALGRALSTTDVPLDRDGLGVVELPLPRAAVPGRWTLAARGGRASFFVAPRPEPAFLVAIPDAPAEVEPGKAFVAHVRARAQDGLPLAGAAVDWRIRARASAGGAVLEEGTGTTDPDGEVKLAHVFAADSPPLDGVAEASVRDAAGRVESAAVPFRVLGPALALALEEELPLTLEVGSRVLARLRATDRGGSAARDVAVLVSVVSASPAPGSAGPPAGEPFAREKPTERDGRVEVELPFLAPGEARVGFAVKDANGRVASLERRVLVRRPREAPLAGAGPTPAPAALPPGQAIALDLDRAHHRAGETATILVRLPRTWGHVLATKERDGVRWSTVARLGAAVAGGRSPGLEPGAVLIDVPLGPEDAPGVLVSVASVASGAVASARAFLPVLPEGPALDLEAVATRTTLRPGELVPLEVRALEGPKRTGTRAELLLACADARPFELLAETFRAGSPLPPAPGLWSARGASPALALAPDVDATPASERPPATVPDDPALAWAAGRLESAAPPAAASLETEADGIAPAGSLSVALDPAPAPFRATVLAASGGRHASASTLVRVVPELSVAVSVPPLVVEGDAGRIEATVARSTDEADDGDVRVALRADLVAVDSAPRAEGAKVAAGHDPEPGVVWLTLPSPGTARLVWIGRFPRAGAAGIGVEARTERARAERRLPVTVQPRGVRREQTIAGEVEAVGPRRLDVPPEDPARPEQLRATLVLAPSLAGAARDAALELARSQELSVEAIAARFAPVLAAPAPVSTASVRAMVDPAVVRVGVLELLELQRVDGAWPGSATATAVSALAVAQAAVPDVFCGPALERGIASIESDLPALGGLERAESLLALAVCGREPTRRAGEPPSEDALYLALASGSGLRVGEVATLARALALRGARKPAEDTVRAVASYALATHDLANVLLLLSELDIDAPKRDQLARLLLSRRRGVVWSTVRESALATRALLAHASRETALPETDLVVRSGKRDLAKIYAAPPERGSLRLELDGRALASLGHRLELAATGGAAPAPFSLELVWVRATSGLRPLDKGIAVKRRIGSAETSPVVEMGALVPVELNVETHASEAIVVEEPLPAGTRVVSVEAPEGSEVVREAGRLRVVLPPAAATFARTVGYTLRAERPGEWRALAARAWVQDRPEFEGESDEWRLRVRE